MNENLSNEFVGDGVLDVPPEQPSTPTKTPNRLRAALIRALASLLVAAVLFIIFSAPIIGFIRGAHVTSDIETEAENAFVMQDITFIIGFYAEEGNARYALVPMGGKFASVRFTGRYLESVEVLLANTYDYLNLKVDSVDNYVTVQGTVEELSEDSAALMYDWFGLNKAQLVEMGAIYDAEDYADLLSDRVLVVDAVDGYNQTLLFVIMGLIAALAFYTLIELCMMAGGIYRPAVAQAAVASGDTAEPEEQDEPSSAPESEGGAEQEEIPAEADGEDMGSAESNVEPEGQDDPSTAPESEGGAAQEEIPAEATGEDAPEADGDAQ